MTPRTRPSTYPQLEALNIMRLHSPASEWKAFRKDARRALTLASTRAAVSALGASWAPRRTDDLARLDRLIAALDSR